jgi:5-methylcytosine-specific restriction endonuclease McrBC regulatory subunit McrC
MGRMEKKERNLTGKVKGKIVFSKNIQKNTLRGRDDRVYCRYLEYTEDIIENQILKAALKKAERFLTYYFVSASGVNNSFRDMVAYCRNALSHVSYKKISRLDLDKIKTTGVYVYYKPVINVAKMVLSEITLEASGGTAVTSYVIPYAVSMDKLFEMYVRAYLKKAGIKSFDSNEPGIKLSQYDDKTAVLRERNKAYSKYIAGNIKPDIILYDEENDSYLVFDVKYKNPLNSRSSRPDRLQILAYALMLNCKNVGNIFPTQDGTSNTYYKRNEINSRDENVRYYNQLNVAVDKDWKFTIQEENGASNMTILEYCKRLLL